jgi:hypothetical protein
VENIKLKYWPEISTPALKESAALDINFSSVSLNG